MGEGGRWGVVGEVKGGKDFVLGDAKARICE